MIHSVNEVDYPRLLEVWENAVKSTHHFLKLEDFEFYKSQIPTYFDDLKLYAHKDEQGRITGFLGVARSKVEMLFVDDVFRGRGIGKVLMTFAINELKIDKVDVNEQNEQAIGFYDRLGFKVVKRSACDEQGKDYPILHLERSHFVKEK